MENYIRDKYERKLFMSDSSCSSSGPMSLKSVPAGRSKNNIMDSEFADEPPSTNLNSFKSSTSDNSSSNFSKQLTLLSEMGFTDTEFNYKTLKAANGNMQEALEIIVAANQKQRRKTVDRNIFDEFEEAKPAQPSKEAVDDSDAKNFKSPPPIQLDDWGFTNEISTKNLEEGNNFAEITAPIQEKKSNINQSSSNNPWGSDLADDAVPDDEVKKTEDPFDSFKAFRSTTSDNYFDNPW